ncbi:hypothetical protein SB659_18420 [Arthrobacter sp. SIMBA_036]|uniref:hypothetical protein n=1 Tax=Arthrobacter sp. SIMBA_036 TaxID=3085778 RepID=UPI00397B2DD6
MPDEAEQIGRVHDGERIHRLSYPSMAVIVEIGLCTVPAVTEVLVMEALSE